MANQQNIFASGSPTSGSDLTTILRFAVNSMLSNVNTILTCTIEDNSNASSNSYTIQPAVNSLDTTGNPLPSPLIYNVPSMLIMGGVAGIIVDYQVNDLVMVGFCQRDITGSVNNQGQANPQTARKFSLSDAIIIGLAPKTLPTTYIHIKQDVIDISAPAKVVVTSPEIDLVASTKVNVESPMVNLGDSATQSVLLQGVLMTINIAGVAPGAGVTGVAATVMSGGSTAVKAAL